MKKPAFFLLALACTIGSCKKSSSGSSGYHVNATISGKGKSFNYTEPVGTIEKSGQTITSLVITGITDPKGEGIQIQLSCFTDKGIVPGTYVDTSDDCTVQIIYEADSDHEYYGGSQVAGWAASSGTTIKNHLKIVITSIDDKSAKGTFSGDLFLDGNLGTPAVPMTSGDFYDWVDD